MLLRGVFLWGRFLRKVFPHPKKTSLKFIFWRTVPLVLSSLKSPVPDWVKISKSVPFVETRSDRLYQTMVGVGATTTRGRFVNRPYK